MKNETFRNLATNVFFKIIAKTYDQKHYVIEEIDLECETIRLKKLSVETFESGCDIGMYVPEKK